MADPGISFVVCPTFRWHHCGPTSAKVRLGEIGPQDNLGFAGCGLGVCQPRVAFESRVVLGHPLHDLPEVGVHVGL